MTTAEALARKITERRKNELEAERVAAVEATKTAAKKTVTPRAKALGAAIIKLRADASAREKTLREMGFTLDSDDQVVTYVRSRGYNERTPEEEAVYKTFDPLFSKLWRLAETAYVKLHGLKATEAKPVLEQFQSDLNGL